MYKYLAIIYLISIKYIIYENHKFISIISIKSIKLPQCKRPNLIFLLHKFNVNLFYIIQLNMIRIFDINNKFDSYINIWIIRFSALNFKIYWHWIAFQTNNKYIYIYIYIYLIADPNCNTILIWYLFEIDEYFEI